MEMNSESGLKMFSNLTENIHLANTYFLLVFFSHYQSEQGIFTLTVCVSRHTNVNNFEHVKQILLAAEETGC